MDDNVGAKFDSIGLQAMANKDKAGMYNKWDFIDNWRWPI